MSTAYRINVRFNLDKPEQRQAVDYLINLSATDKKSRNQFIVDAVIASMQAEQGITLEDIQRIVREELQSVSLAAATPIPEKSPGLTQEQQEENARNVLLDLEMFG